MTATTFRHIAVTAKDVMAALEDFDAQYRDTNAYDGWLDKANYKYVLCYSDRLYPPKYMLGV